MYNIFAYLVNRTPVTLIIDSYYITYSPTISHVEVKDLALKRFLMSKL